MKRRFLMAVAVVALSGGSVWSEEPEEAGSFRTALSVVGGLSVGSPVGPYGGRFDLGHYGSDAGFAVGGGIAHDISPRFTLEANGLYLDRGSSAWSADAGFRLNLAPSSESVVPYFAASGGVYSERSASLVAASNPTPVVSNPTSDVDRHGGRFSRPGMPAVDRRLEIVNGSRRTDGLLSLGGGVRIAAGPHVFVRPDLRAQMVFANDSRVLGLLTLNFGYRF